MLRCESQPLPTDLLRDAFRELDSRIPQAAPRSAEGRRSSAVVWLGPGGERRCGFLLRDCSWSPHSFSSDAFTRPESTPALTARPFSEKAVLTRPPRLTHRLRHGRERMSAHLIGDKCGVGRR